MNANGTKNLQPLKSSDLLTRKIMNANKRNDMMDKYILINSQQILMRRYTKQQKPTSNYQYSSKQRDQHNNSSSKVMLHFPSQVQQYQQEDNTNPVTIYLRSPTKKSYKLQVPAQISIAYIKNIAQEKTAIIKDKQMLHLNGKNVTEYSYIRLQEHNIIHITSYDDLLNPEEQITLKVKVIDSFRKNATENKKYSIKTDINVSQLLQQIKIEREEQLGKSQEKQYIYFLESSRLLEKDKSFHEQEISKNTEIICLITKHELKTRFSNDTKQQILHDISELLGFEQEPAQKQPPKVQRTRHRLRYQRQQKKQQNNIQRNAEQKVTQDKNYTDLLKESHDIEDPSSLSKSVSIPNFKKKKQESIAKTLSLTQTPQRPLAMKLKASKPKKQIDLLLQSQQRQKDVFELPQNIAEVVKQESKKEEEPQKPQKKEESTIMEIHKPAPSIPKFMPVQQRRKIRLEIQKLFDFSDTSESSPPQVKQQERPKSPPTEQPPPRQQKQRQKMRLSMGSRPAFLDQLRSQRNQSFQ